MLPNFLIIGAAKAGTTSLYHYLRQHPQVFMPDSKELNFFIEERRPARDGVWYERHFAGAEHALAIGEASPRYTMHPVHGGVPRRIADLLPAVRLIYLVRDPIERIRSHYLDHIIYGAEKAPIGDAVRTNPIYVSASRYASQIEQYLDYFARDRLLVVTAERLRWAQARTLRQIFEFLGVGADWTGAVLQREFHRIAERHALTRAGWAIVRHPVYRALRHLLPRGLTRVGRALATRPLDVTRATIPADLHRRLAAELHDEVVRLRRYMAEPFDGWGLG